MFKKLLSNKKAVNNSTEIVVIILATILIATVVFAGIKVIALGGTSSIKSKIKSMTYSLTGETDVSMCSNGGEHNWELVDDSEDNSIIYECSVCGETKFVSNEKLADFEKSGDMQIIECDCGSITNLFPNDASVTYCNYCECQYIGLNKTRQHRDDFESRYSGTTCSHTVSSEEVIIYEYSDGTYASCGKCGYMWML